MLQYAVPESIEKKEDKMEANQVKTMKDIVDYAAEKYQDNPAIRYKSGKEVITKTYRDVKHDSESISCLLKSLEMLGKHAAIIGPTTYEWIVSYFGVANSGGVIVPLDAQLPAGEICELMNRADISVLFYDELRSDAAQAAKEKCPQIKHMICLQGELFKMVEEHRGEFSVDIDREKLCAILFTSGTTGKSKGVMLNHRNLTENATCLDMKIPAGTVSMTLLPIHHAYCFTMDILKGLFIGIVICVNDSIRHVSQNMKLFKPEIVLLVPLVIESIYNKLVSSGGILPKKMVAKAAFGGNLKTICSGGAYLNPDLVDAFEEYGITVLQGYGMTECSPVISTNLHWERKKGSVGKLIPNCEAKVVDEEIWIKGSSVMMGYYQMPEETEETLVDGWLRTGDLGYVDEDGFVFLTGRKKNLIILNNGENVSPEELENEISKAPLVKEIIVSGNNAVIEAEIFPDYEYAKKKRIKNIQEKLQEIIDKYNEDKPVYKRIHGLKVRETEFEKTPSKKIKRKQQL